MHVDEMIPSKYLKASDLKNKSHIVVIERLEQASFKNRDGKEEKKWIMYFRGKQKAMALNVTNIKKLAKLHGPENLMWPGKYIEIYPTETNFGGEEVDCIRIREVSSPQFETAPAPAPTPTPTPAPSFAPAPAGYKEPRSTEIDPPDMDDDIPF